MNVAQRRKLWLVREIGKLTNMRHVIQRIFGEVMDDDGRNPWDFKVAEIDHEIAQLRRQLRRQVMNDHDVEC